MIDFIIFVALVLVILIGEVLDNDNDNGENHL